MAIRFPGYSLDPTNRIVPTTDHKVNLDELLSLLRSKDIDRYAKEKDKYFGPTGRYTTGDANE